MTTSAPRPYELRFTPIALALLLSGCLSGCAAPAIMGAAGVVLSAYNAATHATEAAEQAISQACTRYNAAASLAATALALGHIKDPTTSGAKIKALVEYGSAACNDKPPTDGDPVEFAAWLGGIVTGMRAETLE